MESLKYGKQFCPGREQDPRKPPGNLIVSVLSGWGVIQDEQATAWFTAIKCAVEVHMNSPNMRVFGQFGHEVILKNVG